MADAITVTGVKPYDGTYAFDLDSELTSREWGWIKRLAGYTPLQLTDESWADPELACVLAVICMRRAGRIETSEFGAVFDRLIDAPFGSAITIETDDVDAEPGEDDASPPPSNSNGKQHFSGDASTTSSETSEPATPEGSGIPDSATSPSDQVMSGS